MRFVLAALIGLGAGLACRAAAAEPPSPDELAIRSNAQEYVEAFNRGDGQALAALWSEQGVYVDSDTGLQLKGRTAIAEYFQRRFQGDHRPQLSVAVTGVRFITPDVAMEEGLATVRTPQGEELVTSYSAVSVKQGGVWLLDSIHETEVPPPPTAFDHLQPLAWLVGEWSDSGEGIEVRSVYRWSANGAFLTQTYSVIGGERVQMQGTQIIGWDPARQAIRSWMFDSEGGFGEGSWEWDGEHWVVHASMTLPDGRIGSAINVVTPVDVDHFNWKSSGRQVNGELLPNIDEFTVQRVQSPATASTPVQGTQP